jgi:hypothetical protein
LGRIGQVDEKERGSPPASLETQRAQRVLFFLFAVEGTAKRKISQLRCEEIMKVFFKILW